MSEFKMAMERAKLHFFETRADAAFMVIIRTGIGKEVYREYKITLDALRKKISEEANEFLIELDDLFTERQSLVSGAIYEQGFRDGMKLARENFEMWAN